MALGRNKIPEHLKVKSVPCNCYLSNQSIDILGGDKVVRKIFQDAGNKAIIDELNKVK